MRWYEEFPQPDPLASRKQLPGGLSLFDLGGGTISDTEKERSKVLEISRDKMRSECFRCKKNCGDEAYFKSRSEGEKSNSRSRYVLIES